MNNILRSTLMAALLAVTLACVSSNASARDHHRDDDRHEHDRDRHDFHDHDGFRFGLGFHFGGSDRYWVDGHYETRAETVLTHTEYDVQQSDGTVVTIPASYETREVRVWVPGFWAYR